MPGFVGPFELILLGLFLLLLFGPKRLPEIGRSLGHGFRELKDSLTGSSPDQSLGTTTTASLASEATSRHFCHACGANLVPNARFCSACGASVALEQKDNAAKAAP